MKKIEAILYECVSNKIELIPLNITLKIRGCSKNNSKKILQQIKDNKDDLLKYLAEHPEKQPRILVFHSQTLDRDVCLSWQGDNPTVVYLDQLPFTYREISTLKRKYPDAKGLKSICQIKETFHGDVQDQ